MTSTRFLPLALLALAACATVDTPVSDSPAQIHKRLLLLDTHLDTPVVMARPGWDFAARHDYWADYSQADLPRMDAGGLDGGFFVIYTPQGELNEAAYAKALAAALEREAVIRRTVAANANRIELATTAADAERIARSGKHIAYQSIENSWPLGTDLANLKRFYDLGVRMAGPVHSKTNQFADSATGEAIHHGLSALGRQWVAEMNRLGMIVDGSHASDETLEQLIVLSNTPVILSHSGPDAAFEHPRNIPDALMRKLAASGGVMQVNSVYLEPLAKTPKTNALMDGEALLGQTPEQQAATLAQVSTLMKGEEPPFTATFDMFMASLLHALEVMGPDHVGLGADWDGGGGVIGMADVAALPKVTERLLAAGYTESDLQKIYSGNVLRLLRQAEAARER